jgi:prefoldin alpha subunit
MLVGIGAGVTVEKSTEEAISFLRDRIIEMDASGKRLSESLGKLQSQMVAVEQRMQEIYASAQQQIH